MRSLRSLGGWSRRPVDPPAPSGCHRLGAGRFELFGIGAKATNLDHAASHGIAVPVGFVIPPEGDVPDIGDWLDAHDTAAVAVRSAFSAEDRTDESLAGWFTTRLNVTADEFEAAVAAVRSSAALRDGDFRTDVLVMAMVAAERAGVAFSEPETYDDRINVAVGTAERLVGGDEEGEAVMLARLEPVADGWQRRLQALLRYVRSVFGDEPWDIEWADDGESCWLVQIRPITAASRRNEVFTIANHAEILPPLPSALMTSVIEQAGPDLFAWYRRFDRSLPADRHFLEVFAGRPFINLTLLEDLLRHLGLPTALVAESIGGEPEVTRPARPRRMLRKAHVLGGLGLAQIIAVARARRNQQRLASIGRSGASNFDDALADLHDAYVGLVTGMFPLSSAIGPPLAALRKAGTLVEHASRHETITTRLANRLDEAMATDTAAERERFLAEFGHRGVYESDIARPRYRDDTTLLGTRPAASGGPAAEGAGRTRRRTIRGVLTSPLWWLARQPLDARERLRHESMHGFASIRDNLVRLAGEAVERGQLPDAQHLWLLDVDDARRLDAGWKPDDDFWQQRRAERERLAELDPPPLVNRFDDPADWNHGSQHGDRLRGLSLTEGTVHGRAWVLREPSVELPDGYTPDSTVLVARSIDAGWIPTLALVAGAVVEIGGDLSHGSILLRERRMPAITNVRGATRTIRTGEALEIHAGSGVIERLDTQR